MQQLQLGIFVAAIIALVVCGCVYTRKPNRAKSIVLNDRHKEASYV
jgi:hypothetical protein